MSGSRLSKLNDSAGVLIHFIITLFMA